MKRFYKFWLAGLASLMMALAGTSCSKDDAENNGNNNNDNAGNNTEVNGNNGNDGGSNNGGNSFGGFAYGADPGWVLEMEKDKNVKFYDKDGNETECFQLLRNIGFNSARFRVWVNPKGVAGEKYCDKNSVVEKAKRAQALGYKIMIDFHYSDTWCDPSKQHKPAAWDNIKTIDALADAAAEHTTDVLSALKAEGVDVEWVQIGNETATGMLTTQSDGSADPNGITCGFKETSGVNYAKVHNKARAAAREVYPNCKIVVHFQNGQNWDKLNWGLAMLKAGGAEYDILGVSFYPTTTGNGWYESWVDVLIDNLNKVAQNYNKDVMVCEIGAANIASYNSKRAIWNTVIRAKSEVARCKGVFYWEPECFNSFNGYAMGGFLQSGRPSEALDVFGGEITELLAAENTDASEANEKNLYLYDMDGVLLAECTPDADGIWRGTVTAGSDWLNFTAQDGKGVKYGVKDWNTWNSFVKATATYNKLWFGGDIAKAGTYDVWFDAKNGVWGGKAAKK